VAASPELNSTYPPIHSHLQSDGPQSFVHTSVRRTTNTQHCPLRSQLEKRQRYLTCVAPFRQVFWVLICRLRLWSNPITPHGINLGHSGSHSFGPRRPIQPL